MTDKPAPVSKSTPSAPAPVVAPLTPPPSREDPTSGAIAEAAAVHRRFAPAPALDSERPHDRARLREYLGERTLASLTDLQLADAAARLRSSAITRGAAHGAVALRAELEALYVGLDSPTT